MMLTVLVSVDAVCSAPKGPRVNGGWVSGQKPERPDLRLDTEMLSPEECVELAVRSLG